MCLLVRKEGCLFLLKSHPEKPIVSRRRQILILWRKLLKECERYPPGTIRSLLSGISRELINNKAPFAILDKSDLSFRKLHLTLNSIGSEHHHTGVGVNKKSAQVISTDLEDICWEKGSVGTSSPKVLHHIWKERLPCDYRISCDLFIK